MKGVDVDLQSANPHKIETTSPNFQPQVTTTITLHKHSQPKLFFHGATNCIQEIIAAH